MPGMPIWHKTVDFKNPRREEIPALFFYRLVLQKDIIFMLFRHSPYPKVTVLLIQKTSCYFVHLGVPQDSRSQPPASRGGEGEDGAPAAYL